MLPKEEDNKRKALTEVERTEIAEMYRTIDTNHDGVIDYRELVQVMIPLPPELPSHVVAPSRTSPHLELYATSPPHMPPLLTPALVPGPPLLPPPDDAYQAGWGGGNGEDELKRVFAEVDTAGGGLLDLEAFTKLVLELHLLDGDVLASLQKEAEAKREQARKLKGFQRPSLAHLRSSRDALGSIGLPDTVQ
tara:strand:+ start:961 stop:1536 length:576 start_codon:yes stop_codon:yes gene_type:complete